MTRWFGALSVLFGIMLTPAPALAECKIGKYAELPVTMVNRKPIITVQINGRDARFILDSGASFSSMSKATAQEYGLSVTALGPGAEMKGIGGSTSLGTTTVKELRIAGYPIPRVEFLVGGSDLGYAGLLGQNFLGLADVDYDLPHGVVRLTKGEGCRGLNMAYWAGSKPSALVEIEPRADGRSHTVGTVKINGVNFKAAIDSGASGGSMLTLAAAKRIGVTPDSAGVTPSGFALGIGEGRVHIWRAKFDAIDIGGEAINKPVITLIDQTFVGFDMLIGVDFFLTHHIYVDNQYHRMFFTYEGGPVFGLDPKGAFDSTGAALDLTDKAAEPTDAAGYSRRGAMLASSQKFDAAIADFDKAVTMAPGDAHYVFQRAMAHLSNRQPQLGAADLDKAIELAPGDTDARLARAQLRAGARNQAGALADLAVSDLALAPSSDARLRLATAYELMGVDELALTNYDQWLKSHLEDHDRPAALNGRCRTRGVLNRDLDKALDDCNTALRLRPAEPNFLDSRALVQFRRGQLDKALVDYSAIVTAQPRNGWALYARSLVERRAGKTAEADADRTAALSINPQVANRAKRYRLEE